jgi:hypothetical protein
MCLPVRQSHGFNHPKILVQEGVYLFKEVQVDPRPTRCGDAYNPSG